MNHEFNCLQDNLLAQYEKFYDFMHTFFTNRVEKYDRGKKL